jgi:hypothetical protein
VKTLRRDLFLHANHVTRTTFIAHSGVSRNRITSDPATNWHPSRGSVRPDRSVRAMESPQARAPAIHRAAVIRRARAPAAQSRAADCPAEFRAAARSACPVSMAVSPAVRSASASPRPVVRRTTTMILRRCSESMIRKSVQWFSLPTNAERVCAEIMLKQQPALFRRVADRLDVVAIRIQHERAVIIRVIMRANAGRPVVAATCGHRSLVERIDRRAVLC